MRIKPIKAAVKYNKEWLRYDVMLYFPGEQCTATYLTEKFMKDEQFSLHFPQLLQQLLDTTIHGLEVRNAKEETD